MANFSGRWWAVFASLLVVAGCNSVHGEAVAKRSDALTAGPTFTLQLPPQLTTGGSGLTASTTLTLGDRVQVKQPSGSAFAGVVNLGSGQTLLGSDDKTGDLWSVGPVQLQDRVSVNGFLKTAGTVARGTATTITGPIQQGQPLAPPTLGSVTVQFQNGASGVTVANDSTRTLSPGDYAAVVVGARAILALSTGDYRLDSLATQPQSTLRLTTTAGPIRVFVRTSLDWNSTATAAAGDPTKLLVGYSGTVALTIHTPFTGTLLSPSADITLPTVSSPHTGAFFAKTLFVQPGVVITTQAFQQPCQGVVTDDGNACTTDACNPVTGLVSHVPVANGTACSDGNACTHTDTCQAGTCSGTNPVACTAQDQCHNAGVCAPATGLCSNPAKANGASCTDANACTQSDSCQAGACVGTSPVICAATDQCHSAGTCNTATGLCSNPAKANGAPCTDGNACTQSDTCQAGSCVGTIPVLCAALDQCHLAGTCDASSGACSNPVKPNGSACSDANACTQADACQAGACTGANPVTCTPLDQCHGAGSCNPSSGVCSNPPKTDGTACNDGNACTQVDTCQLGACAGGSPVVCSAQDPCHVAGTCSASTGTCSNPVKANGSACSDGNSCTQADACQAGACVGANPVVCVALDQCHVAGSCDSSSGTCSNPPKSDGTACNDANACTAGDVCTSGLCHSGNTVATDDGNPCTTDSCDPAIGLSHAPVSAGTACDDGDSCNGHEACNAIGSCTPGTPPVVDDSNPCTTDSCEPASGVHHEPVSVGTSCSDNNACNGQESCNASGACAPGVAPTVDDGNPCTVDACTQTAGVTHTPAAVGSPCDNSTVCDGREVCTAAGACAPGPAPTVDDGNPCTVDSCDPVSGVLHAPVTGGTACDDGDLCNGREACNAIGLCAAGPAPTVDDNNPCTVDSCDAHSGVRHDPVSTGTSCSDGNACNGEEACTASGACIAANPPILDDGNACTIDVCDPKIGVSHIAAPSGTHCDNATVCDGRELCNATGVCLPSAAPVIDDGNPCTADSCDPAAGVLHAPVTAGTSCDDGDVCNGHEACNAIGMCAVGVAPSVSDNNPCTIDSCDAQSGVHHDAAPSGTACSDSNVCNGAELCDASGTCVGGTPPVIDDGNPCTTDACAPSAGVTHTLVSAGTSCDNATVCDGREKCDAAGHCQAGAPPVVDDANNCTTDSCDPSLGVQHLPTAEGSSCSDGNACTQGDTCHAGTCTSGAAVTCASSDPCQGSACNPSTGTCTQTPKPDGTACSLATACTTGATCHVGQCTGGTPVNVDDNDPCTTDSCDPVTGAKHQAAPLGTLCGDNNACNGQETCDGSGVCRPGVLPVLSDGNPCTADTCDSATGTIQHQPLSAGTGCDDATVCNGREVCNGQGTCVTAPGSDTLDDGNPCTADQCDPIAGITHQHTAANSPCDDNDLCNGREKCDGAGACSRRFVTQLDDQNPCTFDLCDPILGVSHAPVAAGETCNNGTTCDGIEKCDGAGQCLPGVPPVIDDGNPCTFDLCDSFGQVQHTPFPGGTSCDNGNVCDGVSTCNGAGVCQAGIAPVLDDGDACTSDSCDPIAGIKHVRPTSGPCLGVGGWQTLFPSEPSPRDSSAAAFTDTGELFVFGGENAGVSLGDAWLWGSNHSAWRRAAPGPSARAGAAIGFDAQRGRVIVYGGVAGADANADYLGDVWEYAVATDSWQPRPATGSVPANRALAAFAYDSLNQRGLLFGGVGPTHLADTWEWSASTGGWTQVSTQGPAARFGAAFAFDPVHKIYVLFGGSPQGVTGGALGDTWTFDSNTGLWSSRTPTTKPPARAGASMTYDAGVSRLVMVGGTSVDSLNLADAWEFDAPTGDWAPLTASAPPALTGAVAGFDSVAGQVLLTGGLSYSDSGKFTADLGLVWSFARPNQQWVTRTVTSAPAQLALGAVFDTNTNRIVARAAVDQFDTSTRPVMWNYDGSSRAWKATDAAALSTDFGSGAFKGVGTLLYDTGRKQTLRVWGSGSSGFNSGPELQTANWDGAQWTTACALPNTNSEIFGLTEASYVFDPPRARILAFGDGHLIALDPSTCTAAGLSQSSPAPSPRRLASLAWDSDRDVFVLFGGSLDPHNNGGFEKGDTWELNPRSNTWALIATAIAPSARYGATMVYDAKRKKMVLYGGGFAATHILRDTWAYGPGGWSEVSASGGPASGAATVLFDPARTEVTLVGTDGNVSIWNGSSWVQDANTASPSARSGMSGGWVSSQGAAFLFGGVSGDGRRTFLGDLWMWNGGWRLLSFPGPDPSPLLWGAWPDARGKPTFAVGPPARTGHVLATGGDISGEIAVLFGGEGDAGLLNDTWILSDTTLEWQPINQIVTPAPRTGHAMSSFPGQGYALFGGLTRPSSGQDTLVNDTWFWTASGWTSLSSAFTTPPARFGHAMATDTTAKQVILFGGRGANGVLGDTWLLDLNTLQSTGWQKLNPANSPLPRFGHSMTFDTKRNKIVLTGGEGAEPNQVFSDTWEWDATNRSWVRRNIVPMDGRAAHAAFFDENLEQTMVFGGFAHEPHGVFAQTRGDTLAFVNADQTDPTTGHPNGDKCGTGTDCGSGTCTDGVCCDSSCTGQCAACDVPGHEGTCSATRGAPHGARASCSGQTGECGMMCDGADMTACHLAPTGLGCGPAPGCNGGIFVQGPGTCDGLGTCAQAVTSCLPLGCGTAPPFRVTGCITQCFADNDCFSSDYRCSRSDGHGICYLKDQIVSFTVSPSVLTSGTTVTMTVEGTVANSQYQFAFVNAAQSNHSLVCGFSSKATSCVFTLTPADVGLGTFSVSASAPQAGSGGDDTRSVNITIGAQP